MKEEESKKPTKLSYCANMISHTIDLQIKIRTVTFNTFMLAKEVKYWWEELDQCLEVEGTMIT
ncbi:hypothetical protein CR513_20857, partial [Mucuna pruriens]